MISINRYICVAAASVCGVQALELQRTETELGQRSEEDPLLRAPKGVKDGPTQEQMRLDLITIH